MIQLWCVNVQVLPDEFQVKFCVFSPQLHTVYLKKREKEELKFGRCCREVKRCEQSSSAAAATAVLLLLDLIQASPYELLVLRIYTLAVTCTGAGVTVPQDYGGFIP